MLGTSRRSTYSWLVVFGASALLLLALQRVHGEAYGSGLAMIAIVLGASGLCLVLPLVALTAYFLGWCRAQPFLVRDKVLVLVSFIGLAVFARPVSLRR